MFGMQPGEELRQGVLNQFVVSKLVAPKVTYWVLHTKGEDPRSILITAITREKVPHDRMMGLVGDIYEVVQLDQRGYDRVSGDSIQPWGDKGSCTIAATVKDSKGSRMLGLVRAEDVE